MTDTSWYRKLNVFLRIISNYEKLKNQITNGIFTPIQTYLNYIKKTHYNPAIFYAANFLLHEIDEMKNSAIIKLDNVKTKYEKFLQTGIDINYLKSFPINNDKYRVWTQRIGNINEENIKLFNGDFETYLEQICDFSRIKGIFNNVTNIFTTQMYNIVKVEGRPTIQEFELFYFKIKQELVNYLDRSASQEQINFHISVLFATTISAKPLGTQNNIINNLRYFIMHYEDLQNESYRTDIDIMKRILAFIDLLNSLFTVINNQKLTTLSNLDIELNKVEIQLDKDQNEIDKHYSDKSKFVLNENELLEKEKNITNNLNTKFALLQQISEAQSSVSQSSVVQVPYTNPYFNTDSYKSYYSNYIVVEGNIDPTEKKLFYHALPYQLIYKILHESYKFPSETVTKRVKPDAVYVKPYTSYELKTDQPQFQLQGGGRKKLCNKRTKKARSKPFRFTINPSTKGKLNFTIRI